MHSILRDGKDVEKGARTVRAFVIRYEGSTVTVKNV